MTATQTPGRGCLPGDVNPAGRSQQPRPGTETPDDRAGRLLAIGLDVATRLRAERADTVAPTLDRLNRQELRDLVLLLAGAVDIHTTVRRLYSWLRPVRDLRPCGTYAGYKRHVYRGEPVDDLCVEALREHDRARKERTRAARRTAVAA